MASSRYFENDSIESVLRDARMVVFDLNGLILDDEPLQIAAVNAVLERSGIRFDEETWLRRFFGRRSADYFSQILRDYEQLATPELVETLVAEKDWVYRNLLAKQLRQCIFPGAVSLVRHLHEQGSKILALATSASRQELHSAMGNGGLGMLDMFRIVVCGEDVIRGKPNPEVYRRVAALSGVAPSSALVFEDSRLGVRAAVGAGMPVIAVPNRFTQSQNFTGAVMTISDLTPQATIISTRSGQTAD